MPDPTLQATALRYAAGDLSAEEVAAFEARLARDQAARDALAEAVRLSAQAIGQKPPAPHPVSRAVIRDRLNLSRYRGHPLGWIALGAAAVAACTLIGLALADRVEPEAVAGSPLAASPESAPAPHTVHAGPAVAPMPRESSSITAVEPPPLGCSVEDQRSIAEIWAELSTHESVEKARDDELRWRQRVRELSNPHVLDSVKVAGPNEVRDP